MAGTPQPEHNSLRAAPHLLKSLRNHGGFSLFRALRAFTLPAPAVIQHSGSRTLIVLPPPAIGAPGGIGLLRRNFTPVDDLVSLGNHQNGTSRSEISC